MNVIIISHKPDAVNRAPRSQIADRLWVRRFFVCVSVRFMV